MPSMKETFRKRVGNYYLGRTLGEACCPPSDSTLLPHTYVAVQQWCVSTQSATATDSTYLSVQGTYAKVKYGQHVQTGEVVAVKVQPTFIPLHCSGSRE